MAKKKKTNEDLSPEQVFDVLEFAKQLNILPNYYNPMLVNERLKDLNMNPVKGTADDIDKALLNPKANEKQLRGYSEYLEYTNMQYKRILDYVSKMNAFDYTYHCTNATYEDYKSKAFKKDLSILEDFLTRFDCKKEFKKVMRSLVRQDAHFCAFRDDEEQYTLQELPIDYCMISGMWEKGYLFDFNVMYFLTQAGTSVDMFPSVFRKYLKRASDVKKNNTYDPGVKIEAREGAWQYWVQTNPEDNVWCWKFNMEQAGQVPMFAALFPDLINLPFVRSLQNNKYIIEASKILIGIVPMLKENKSGNVSDMMAIKAETLGKFSALIKAALPDAIKFGVAPLEKVESFDFKSDGNNLLSEYNKNTSAESGINARLIFSTDKQNAEETRNSIGVDEYLVNYIYPYFNDFMNYQINKRTKKFKFKIEFEGSEFPTNRQVRLDNALKLLDKGIVLPMKISAALGHTPMSFQQQLDMARANGWTENLTPIVTAYTSSSKDINNKGGRPQKDDSDLSEGGLRSREQGSNIEKGGSE